MATKSSNKGMKAAARAGKGATKTGVKKAAKQSARAAKSGAKKAIKAATATKAKSTQGKATKAAGAGKVKSIGGAVSTIGTQVNNVQIVPYDGPDAEDNIVCRTRSPQNLFPDIITRVGVDNDPADGRFRLTLFFSSIDGIRAGTFPDCNADGLAYQPERSANIASVSAPEYLGRPVKRIRVKIFPLNPQQPLPFTFAFRLRFTQNITGLDSPIPRKKNGSIKVR